MVKIVSFAICPFVQRVTAALEAKGVPYQIQYIDLSDKPKWFVELSPSAQVPVLVTESGTALFESDAIIEYIDDVYGPLEEGVSAEQKALDRAWSYQASKHYLSQCSTMRSADEATLVERASRLGKAFGRAEGRLGAGPFFKGTDLSKVDIAWLPLLHRAWIIEAHTGYDLLASFPNVKRWQAALLETGLAQRAVSDDFEARFTAFYVSDETYLGQRRRSRVEPGRVRAPGELGHAH